MPQEKEITKADRWRLKKLAAGLCGTCGREKLLTKNHCAQCASDQREKSRNTYRIRHGIPVSLALKLGGRPRLA